MIPVTYPSSVSTSKESQMVVYSLSSVAGLQRWTDYIPVKYQSTGSDVPNSFNTNGYIACDFITNLTGKQAWVDYIPVFVDNLATTAWQVSDTGFIPFNTLAGGGTYVSLDLNFLNTTALDSRITFSRGTNATLTGSNGLIQYAPHNLLTNSEDFEAAAWVKAGSSITANTTTAPDATTTGDKLVENAAFAEHMVYVSSLGTGQKTGSVYLKAAERTRAFIYFFNATDGVVSSFFDLSAGTVTAGAGTITPVGNGWYRCTLTRTATASDAMYIGSAIASGSSSYTGDGTSGIFIWGAQLNVGSTAQSYNSTTPKNLLGFTQEPENAAWTKSNSYVQQNLVLWSEDVSNGYWLKLAGGASASATTFNFASTFGSGYEAAITIAAGTTLTASFFAAGSGTIQICIVDGSGAFGVTATTVNLTSTLTRYTVTRTTVDANAILRVRNISGVAVTGATCTQMQLVQGSTAGDYTQTTSAAAPTRYLNWDGTLTGRKLVEDTAGGVHVVYASTAVAAVPYTLSMYAKPAERNFARLDFVTSAYAAGSTVILNLTTGVTTVTNYGATTGTTATAVSVGGGWYRLTMTVQATAATYFSQIGLSSTNSTGSYTGDGTSGIYVSDFQLSNSASVDPYVYNPQAAAASAAFYGPRIDYDPVTLASRGLLIEEQRTNLCLQSENFTTTWSSINQVSINPNSIVAPDGTLSGDKLIADATSNVHFVVQNTGSIAAPWTFSCYAKAGEYNRVGFSYSNTGYVFFNLSTGLQEGTVGAGITSTAITAVGNGWYRISFTSTSTASGANIGIYVFNTAYTSGGPVFTGDGTSGLFLWGAQAEAGSFATSYIPTVASQVTRNADSASMLGDNFYTWCNPNQGTLYVETGPTSDTVYPTGAVLTDGTSSNNILIQGASPATSQQFYIVSGGVAQVNLATQAFSSTLTKTAAAYKANDFAYSTQGAAVSTDVAGSVPTVSQLVIGAERTSNLFNGTIRRIGYYNTRLPNATLQAMTT